MKDRLVETTSTPRRGFVTVATGREDFYRLARTLLISYQMTSESPLPFAILCDRENQYTAGFDRVILLEHPTNSWMDKLELLVKAPYEETIFIDADCIAYDDLNRLWASFEGATDISSPGLLLPMDSKVGWFTPESVGKYAPQLKYLLDFHGGIYFLRPGELCRKMYGLCKEIAAHYGEYRFKTFTQPADEPVIALAMALCGCVPVRVQPWHYCRCTRTTTIDAADFFARKLVYTCQMTDVPEHVDDGMLLHFSIGKTIEPLYNYESAKVHWLHRHGRPWGKLTDRAMRLRAVGICKVRKTSRRMKKKLRKRFHR